MDAVYILKDGDIPELRYSLRSLYENVLHQEVFLVGGKPWWVENVTHIPNDQQSTAYTSTRSHIRKACLDPRISDPFMLWNDDFYAMNYVGDLEPLHRGPLVDVVAHYEGVNSPWVKGMRETYEFLRKADWISEPLSYDLHVPLIVHKKDMLEALNIAQSFKSDAVQVRTIYGNITDLGGEQIEDPKVLHRKAKFPTGDWMSSSDNTYRSTVEPVLRYSFPVPCFHEKEGSQ